MELYVVVKEKVAREQLNHCGTLFEQGQSFDLKEKTLFVWLLGSSQDTIYGGPGRDTISGKAGNGEPWRDGPKSAGVAH